MNAYLYLFMSLALYLSTLYHKPHKPLLLSLLLASLTLLNLLTPVEPHDYTLKHSLYLHADYWPCIKYVEKAASPYDLR